MYLLYKNKKEKQTNKQTKSYLKTRKRKPSLKELCNDNYVIGLCVNTTIPKQCTNFLQFGQIFSGQVVWKSDQSFILTVHFYVDTGTNSVRTGALEPYNQEYKITMYKCNDNTHCH